MDWVQRHQASITFVVTTLMGCILIILGSAFVGDSEPGLVALGAGALGLNGYVQAANHKKEA